MSDLSNRLKHRPALWIGELCVTLITVVAMLSGHDNIATAGLVAMAALLPKLVESEEKGA